LIVKGLLGAWLQVFGFIGVKYQSIESSHS
jgi:hypothetical protein